MTFDPFQISSCPICKKKLLHFSSPADPFWNIYECATHIPPRHKGHASRTHYFVSIDKNSRPITEITIPGFHLMYTPDSTIVYKEGIKPSTDLPNTYSVGHHYVFELNQHIPIDFSDLRKTYEKLKLMVLFS